MFTTTYLLDSKIVVTIIQSRTETDDVKHVEAVDDIVEWTVFGHVLEETVERFDAVLWWTSKTEGVRYYRRCSGSVKIMIAFKQKFVRKLI